MSDENDFSDDGIDPWRALESAMASVVSLQQERDQLRAVLKAIAMTQKPVPPLVGAEQRLWENVERARAAFPNSRWVDVSSRMNEESSLKDDRCPACNAPWEYPAIIKMATVDGVANHLVPVRCNDHFHDMLSGAAPHVIDPGPIGTISRTAPQQLKRLESGGFVPLVPWWRRVLRRLVLLGEKELDGDGVD